MKPVQYLIESLSADEALPPPEDPRWYQGTADAVRQTLRRAIIADGCIITDANIARAVPSFRRRNSHMSEHPLVKV
jgi:ADP-glucose pyrophosphorylase